MLQYVWKLLKFKRASRSHAKTGFFLRSFGLLGALLGPLGALLSSLGALLGLSRVSLEASEVSLWFVLVDFPTKAYSS